MTDTQGNGVPGAGVRARPLVGALIAAGLSLIFGLMNVVNVAHGSFFMLGAFFGFSAQQMFGSFWVALLLAPLPAVVMGAVIPVGTPFLL